MESTLSAGGPSMVPFDTSSATRFPSMERYLSRLPLGLASYPAMTAKGSSLRSTLADAPQPLLSGLGLPPRLEELVRLPPAPSDWIREAELWALALAVYDNSFAHSGGLPAYREWVYAMTRRLLSSPAYRILFALISPEQLFLGAAYRWAAFHRGTGIEVIKRGTGAGACRVTTPPHLLPEIAHIALAEGIRAALAVAKGDGAEVVAHAESSTCVLLEARWK